MSKKSGVKLHDWDSIEEEALSSLITRKMMWGKHVMLSQVFIKAGGIVPLHQHENEQFSYMLTGCMKFWLERDGGEEIIVRAGEVLHLPPNVPHGAVALEDAMSLDVFSPPRADWIAGTDAYLRGEDD
ncbi:MAG: cupin domain-containing protein [Bacteroidota bacterium]